MPRSSNRTTPLEEKRKQESTKRTSGQGTKRFPGRTGTDKRGHANEEYLQEESPRLSGPRRRHSPESPTDMDSQGHANEEYLQEESPRTARRRGSR